jgi:hypothetical protein
MVSSRSRLRWSARGPTLELRALAYHRIWSNRQERACCAADLELLVYLSSLLLLLLFAVIRVRQHAALPAVAQPIPTGFTMGGVPLSADTPSQPLLAPQLPWPKSLGFPRAQHSGRTVPSAEHCIDQWSLDHPHEINLWKGRSCRYKRLWGQCSQFISVCNRTCGGCRGRSSRSSQATERAASSQVLKAAALLRLVGTMVPATKLGDGSGIEKLLSAAALLRRPHNTTIVGSLERDRPRRVLVVIAGLMRSFLVTWPQLKRQLILPSEGEHVDYDVVISTTQSRCSPRDHRHGTCQPGWRIQNATAYYRTSERPELTLRFFA